MKIKCMLTVLHAIYDEGGAPAALAKIDRWYENGWLYPHEKRILLDSVAIRFDNPDVPSCDTSGNEGCGYE